MAFAWERGLRYSIMGPDGRRDIAAGTPFGGIDAPMNRARFVPMLLDDLAGLPAALAANLWDEASHAEPRFHRVDPASYAVLLDEAQKRNGSHLAAMLFLPRAFEAPFDMPVVFERLAGSAPLALQELEAGDWTAGAASARETLIDALRDAVSLQLPMIVDA
jgi:hypothetical protein